jgi:hypothetical protein
MKEVLLQKTTHFILNRLMALLQMIYPMAT